MPQQQVRVPPQHWHAITREDARATDEAILRQLIEAHFRYTGSFRAKDLLHDWQGARARFVKVMPHEYRRALSEANAANATASTAKATA